MATAPFVVVPELTAIAIAYRNPDAAFIADGAMPRVKPVGKQEFTYTVHDMSAFDRPDSRVGRKGRPNEIGKSDKPQTAAVEDYGLEDPIPQADIDQGRAQGRDIVGEATEYLMGMVHLDRECRVAGIVQDPGNYAGGNQITLSGTDKFSDDTSDPIKMLLEYLDTPMIRPNTVTMPAGVLSRLRVHPKVVQAIYPSSNGGGMVTREQIRALLEVKTLLVGEAFVNVARKGQTANLARAWGPHVAMTYLDPAASTDRGVTWGMTVPYGTPFSGTIDDPYIGLKGGKRVRAGEQLKELVTAKDAGFLVRSVL
jgi:hypothetical protein